MVDSEYSPDNYEPLKISIGSITKNLEMLRFVADHLKTKKMCKHAIKKLGFVMRFIPDRNKTQEMCDKAILEYDGTFCS